MATAPMDMLRKCRDVFKSRAEENRAYSTTNGHPDIYRTAAGLMADENFKLVEEIDATLREWG